jgi:hypothetical protein
VEERILMSPSDPIQALSAFGRLQNGPGTPGTSANSVSSPAPDRSFRVAAMRRREFIMAVGATSSRLLHRI